MATVTREALYELVWTTPLKKLAEQFAITDVGLAKICKRLAIPRPAQGYWMRVLHQRAEPRPPLPPKREDIPAAVELGDAPQAATPRPPEVRREKPTLEMRETLAGAHPAIRELAALLKDEGRTRDEMRIVAHRDQATFRASSGQQNRALRILDALSRWCQNEGYRVALTPVPNDRWRHALVVTAKEDSFRISILERQRQVEHVKTKEERERELRYGSSWGPKYDHQPAGTLTLDFLDLRYSRSYGRWSDGKGRLETRLGDIALGVGDAFRELALARARREEEARLQQLEARRRAREQEWLQHDERLKVDLDEMVARWDHSQRIRAFLDAAAPMIIACAEDRAAALGWLVWARNHARAVDPLSWPNDIPKRLRADSSSDARKGLSFLR